jgi:hypothetical protein
MIPSYKIYDYMLDLSNRKINLFFLQDLQNRNLDGWNMFVHRNLRQLRYWPTVMSHDQELLDWNLYTDDRMQDQAHFQAQIPSSFLRDLNLRWRWWNNVHDSFMITHSEKNSDQVEKYKDAGWTTVYFWSHAVLALDWYRYARYDPVLDRVGTSCLRDFLIYSRGWQGSREYRLRFADQLCHRGLQPNCHHSMLLVENQTHMQDHVFQDPRFAVDDLSRLVTKIRPCTASGDASADYCNRDFVDTAISVVMETNYVRPVQHLTEKILRPIAVGHPFILMSSPGCLQYLRDYGFKTFDPLIDETYDTETDPIRRMDLILCEMQRLSQLPTAEKKQLHEYLYEIARYNREWFFGMDFRDAVMSEFRDNFLAGISQVKDSAHSRVWLTNITQRKREKGMEYHRQRRSVSPWAPILSRRYRQRLSGE